jgi:hypothetical protein
VAANRFSKWQWMKAIVGACASTIGADDDRTQLISRRHRVFRPIIELLVDVRLVWLAAREDIPAGLFDVFDRDRAQDSDPLATDK